MKIKKICLLVISLFLLFIANSFMVLAIENNKTYYDDQNKYGWTTNVVTNELIAKDTTFIHDAGTSIRNGSKVEQNLYMLLQESNSSEGIKTVTWGGYKQNHSISEALPRLTLADIAKDYEANHPGWKVIGGINADQYCWGYGADPTKGYDLLENRPYYTMKADGENWFSHHFMGGNCANLVGFLNDGANQLVYDPGTAGMDPVFKLNVYDENKNFIKEFNVNDLNPKNKVSGEYTYVYALTDTGNNNATLSRQKQSTSVNISSDNDLYIISNADKTWVSNSVDYAYFKNAGNSGSRAVNSFFGKGTIDQIGKSTTLTATQFAVETTNNELLGYLKKGAYVVAQYEIGGGYLNCESAIGFHTVQRLNGVDMNVDNSYNTRGYPRSVVGFTEDGKVALITGNGTSKSGFYAQEINAVCKAYNIKTAFQMDGGGSVTMILRNQSGGFDVVNNPSDGSARSIYNGLFFVVKDATTEVNIDKVTGDSIELSVDIKDFGMFSNVSKSYVNIKGSTATGKVVEKTQEIVNGKVKFDNLESNVKYTYNIQFKVDGKEELEKSFTSGEVYTAKEMIAIKEFRIEYEEGNLKVSIMLNDPDKSIDGLIKLSFDGGENFEFVTPGKSYTIKEFEGDPLSNIYIKFDYNLNDGEGNKTLEYTDIKIVANPVAYMEAILYNINSQCESCFKSK